MLVKLLLLGLVAFLAQGKLTDPYLPDKNLTLPWGTWLPTNYNEKADFYTFSNVRFGRATNGSMRFNAPSFPDPIENRSVVQDNTYGPACPQVNMDPNVTCGLDGNGTISAPNVVPIIESIESEDCLFLDIYVPSSGLTPGSLPELPVIVWIYGGAYLVGAKNTDGISDFLSNGTGILEAAWATDQSKAIFIVGNYRVGAFGWLAGSQMEKNATPNAGLHDQRLLLRWVQEYVHLIGGDKSKVSAWGGSAGAGSILHHLISDEGRQDPLFSKAILQSPAFQLQWDRAGTLDAMYNNFSDFAYCPDHSIECLQQANISTLINANQKLVQSLPCTGLFPVGPSLDGNLIKQLPAVAFDSGNYWKGLESIIVTHVFNEAVDFVPDFIVNQTGVEDYVADFFPQPKLSELRTAVLKEYPETLEARKRAEDIIRDLSFTCNTRLLYDAYHMEADTYMMQYDVLFAHHGFDALPLFWSTEFDLTAYLASQTNDTISPCVLGAVVNGLAPSYQSYLASHAIHGDPNTGKQTDTPQWNPATNDSNFINQVMQVGRWANFNPNFQDGINTNQACDFWKEAAWNITKLFPCHEFPRD